MTTRADIEVMFHELRKRLRGKVSLLMLYRLHEEVGGFIDYIMDICEKMYASNKRLIEICEGYENQLNGCGYGYVNSCAHSKYVRTGFMPISNGSASWVEQDGEVVWQ